MVFTVRTVCDHEAFQLLLVCGSTVGAPSKDLTDSREPAHPFNQPKLYISTVILEITPKCRNRLKGNMFKELNI